MYLAHGARTARCNCSIRMRSIPLTIVWLVKISSRDMRRLPSLKSRNRSSTCRPSRLARWKFIHFVKVFFCTASRWSATFRTRRSAGSKAKTEIGFSKIQSSSSISLKMWWVLFSSFLWSRSSSAIISIWIYNGRTKQPWIERKHRSKTLSNHWWKWMYSLWTYIRFSCDAHVSFFATDIVQSTEEEEEEEKKKKRRLQCKRVLSHSSRAHCIEMRVVPDEQRGGSGGAHTTRVHRPGDDIYDHCTSLSSVYRDETKEQIKERTSRETLAPSTMTDAR